MKTILPMSRRSSLCAPLLILVSCSRHAFDPVMEQTKLLHQDAEWADLASAGKVLGYAFRSQHQIAPLVGSDEDIAKAKKAPL